MEVVQHLRGPPAPRTGPGVRLVGGAHGRAGTTNHGGFWVWDVRTGEVVQKFETDKPVTSMEIAEDDATVVTADGCNVRFWDLRTRKLIKVHTEPFLVESASYCKEKGYFAAGGEDMWVRLFDFETCKELDCNKGHHGPVHNVRFAPGGETYSSGSEDGTIRIWRSMPS